MEIRKYVMGQLGTNTYLLTIGDSCILIDPASRAEKLIEILGDLKLEAVLLTHGHFDHIKAVDGLYEKYHMPTYLFKDDIPMARDKYAGLVFGMNAYISTPVKALKEGKMQIGPFCFDVISTPGHTPGSCIFVFDEDIFTGDTLFKLSIGRTDLEGGDETEMRSSLKVFSSFTKNYLLHPGHEEETNLFYELRFNPYLN